MIEDDRDICGLVESRLSTVGFEVLTAYDGEEGLRQVRAEKPDLVVLDLVLPKLPGEEICKAIREDEDEEITNIPIVMYTAKDELTDRIIGRIVGATAYVVKTSGSDALLKKIMAALPESGDAPKP